MEFVIDVSGSPAPQGSKVQTRYGGLREASKKVGPWRNAVRTEVQFVMDEPMVGSVAVAISFRLPRPKGHYGTGKNLGRLRDSAPIFPTTVPDIDKLIRSTLDGMTEGGAFRDDSQVVSVYAIKTYCSQDQAPGATITITLLETGR